MTIEELINYKNFIYDEYDRAKNEHSNKARGLAFQVASLEESIADELIKAGDLTRAAINLVSQGSLLMELGRIAECKAAWEKALSVTTNEKLKAWIQTGLAQCQSSQ